MKSLADRHADRAQRKADNLAESSAPTTTGNVGNAANLIVQAQEAFGALNEKQRDELKAVMTGDIGDGFRSIAEDDTGALKMAGIGVINPLVTPAGEFNKAAGEGVQATGELPVASFDPKNGNINGQAVAAAGNGAGEAPETGADGFSGGWGAMATGQAQGTPQEPENGTPNDGYSALTITELKAKLDDAKVTYDSKTNKDGLIDLLRASDKAKASEPA